MNFDWQTEEGSDFERPLPGPDNSGSSQRPYWLILFVLVVLVGAFYGVRRVRDTVDQAQEGVKQDVRTAHGLAQMAAERRDEELLVSILSGRSAGWVAAQVERLEAGLLFEDTLRPFGLIAQGDAGTPAVTLNADLTEALLVSRNTFVVKSGAGVTSTVTLTQTHVYRQGDQRWLLSPPLPEFWGLRRGHQGRILTVTYPARDEGVVLRLAEDLESSLEEMCREVANCPDGFDVRLRLETDPRSILLASDGGERLSTGSDVTLPTPTLVGLPADDEAYQSLFRGYASYVLSAALTEMAGYRCCQGVLFQQALLDLQMARLDLAPEPVRRGEYLHLIDADDSVAHMRRLWDEEEIPSDEGSIPLEVYAFLDYVQTSSGPSPGLYEIQRASGGDVSFWEWLERLSEYDLPAEIGALQGEWSTFVQEQLQEAQSNLEAGLGRPQPAQDVVLLCGDETLDIYRLLNGEGQLRLEMESGYQSGTLAALPADDGFVVSGDRPGSTQEPLQTQLKLNGNGSFPISAANISGESILPTGFEPESGKLVSLLFSSENSGGPLVGVTDPYACAPDGCQYEIMPGTPYWSPDGSQVLAVASSRSVRLYLRRGSGGDWEEVVEHGYQPFWLDNRTFAYFPSYIEGRQRMVSATSIDGRSVPDFVTVDAVRPTLPEQDRSRVLRFAWINRHPYDPDALLAVLVPTYSGDQSHLVVLRRSNGNVGWLEAEVKPALLHSFDGVVINLGDAVRYSPSGRWLTLMINYGQGPEDVGLTIYDLQNGEEVLRSGAQEEMSVESARGDWSADGRWYVRSVPGAVDMVAPGIRSGDRPLRRVVSHDLPRCQSAQWVNREE